MKTRRIILRQPARPVPAPHSRWTAWAVQLIGRRARLVVASRLPLSLHVRAYRVPLLLCQRWLSFQTQVRPRINLAIAANAEWHVAPPHVSAPRMILLQTFAGLLQRTRTLATERRIRETFAPARALELRRTTLAPVHDTVGRALTLEWALTRTRTEHLASVRQKYFVTRQEAVLNEVARRLIRRLQRVDEVSIARPPMALHSEAQPAMTTAPLYVAAPAEQSQFERRHSAHTAAALRPLELNVEHLTEQVMKQIDRRIIARRERLGQV
jgi:hypothetical protein